MKKLLFLLLATATFAACDDDTKIDRTNKLPKPPTGYIYATENTALGENSINEAMLFYGASLVNTLGSSSTFTDTSARFEIKKEVNGQIYLYMHAIRFAGPMPGIEMRLIAPAVITGGVLSMTGTTIVPQYYLAASSQWVDNEKYTITDFDCEVTGIECRATFTCATDFKVTYKGNMIVAVK